MKKTEWAITDHTFIQIWVVTLSLVDIIIIIRIINCARSWTDASFYILNVIFLLIFFQFYYFFNIQIEIVGLFFQFLFCNVSKRMNLIWLGHLFHLDCVSLDGIGTEWGNTPYILWTGCRHLFLKRRWTLGSRITLFMLFECILKIIKKNYLYKIN